jgi:hypothetical protein
MPAIENLLAPASTELPDCKCGAELRLFAVKSRGDTAVRIFKCDTCDHEFRLMVWAAPVAPSHEPDEIRSLL